MSTNIKNKLNKFNLAMISNELLSISKNLSENFGFSWVTLILKLLRPHMMDKKEVEMLTISTVLSSFFMNSN